MPSRIISQFIAHPLVVYDSRIPTWISPHNFTLFSKLQPSRKLARFHLINTFRQLCSSNTYKTFILIFLNFSVKYFWYKSFLFFKFIFLYFMISVNKKYRFHSTYFCILYFVQVCKHYIYI